MNENLKRYLTGTGFVFCAICLDFLGEPVLSLLSAIVGLYMVGSLLLEIMHDSDQNNTHKPA